MWLKQPAQPSTLYRVVSVAIWLEARHHLTLVNITPSTIELTQIQRRVVLYTFHVRAKAVQEDRAEVVVDSAAVTGLGVVTAEEKERRS